MADRRQILFGAAGIVAATTPIASRAAAAAANSAVAQDGFIYDYIFATLHPGANAAPTREFVAALPELAKGVKAAGGEALGYLTPQIGWTSQDVAVILRWKGEQKGRDAAVAAITNHPAVLKAERSPLTATVRPAPSDLPLKHGIYTHRWFETKESDVPEFIDLSNRAWPYFEDEFASRIFGLFRAQQTPEEKQRGVVRMLLNTQYDSHAVWEASRTPTSNPTELFARRNAITITTKVASLSFKPLS